MLNVTKLLSSELLAISTGAEFKAAVQLWCRAWQQIPAASLPNDDRILASFAGFGSAVKEWRKVRAVALHGFVRCADGRLYHLTLADDAKRAAAARHEFKRARDADRERLRRWRRRQSDGAETEDETRFETPDETGTKRVRRDETVKDEKESSKGGGRYPSALSIQGEISRVDCQEMAKAVEAWNAMAARCGLPRAQRITPQRRTKLRARLAECGGLDGWKDACARVERSSFLRGDNQRSWRADLDFIIGESSFCKLLEGRYDDAPHGPKKAGCNIMAELDSLAGRGS